MEETVTRTFLFSSDWAGWVQVGLAVVSGMVLIGLYRVERRLVSKKLGLSLVALRLALVGLVVFMLGAPILVVRTARLRKPVLTVLRDESASMQVPNARMTRLEAFRQAKWSGQLPEKKLPFAPVRLEAVAWRLRLISGRLSGQPGKRTKGPTISDLLSRIQSEIANAKKQQRRLPKDLAARLDDLSSRFQTARVSPLKTTPDRKKAAAAVRDLADRFELLAKNIDSLLAKKINIWNPHRGTVAATSRLARVHTIFSESFRKALSERFEVKIIPFSGPEGEANQTDIVGAYRQAVAADRPGAVLIFSDGRQNVFSGSEQVNSFPIFVGYTAESLPPRDVAIEEIHYPDTLFEGESLSARVLIRATGFAGKAVRVCLKDTGGKKLAEKEIVLTADPDRREVVLQAKPRKGVVTGYRVEIEAVAGEAVASNNIRSFSIRAGERRTRVLLVDRYPRWEYRYLRNLLLRDRGVKLQAVLLSPSGLPGAEPEKPIKADPRNDSPRATQLPATAEELAPFDVVILGDVGPDQLPIPHQRALVEFVSARGGALIAIAGRSQMPRALAGLPLWSVLPVRQRRIRNEASQAGAESKSFRIEITPRGAQHPITRLWLDPRTNRDTWRALPPIHWRSRGFESRPAATVLARASSSSADPSSEARQASLICVQRYGLGRVLYFGFDGTWRLRYKEGDKRHRQFWTQVLRWASGPRLPAGEKLARLGTDRAQYHPGQPVRITARLSKGDLSPLNTARPQILITTTSDGGGVVIRRPLGYQPASPGVYSTTLSDLPPGQYNATLAGVDSKPTVHFSVTKAITTELIELSGDRDFLAALAGSSTHVVPLWMASELLTILPDTPTEIVSRKEMSLWDSWGCLFAFIGLITAEWILRKRGGLV